jgi:predicted DNA-binding transcriptional regulator AlpA
MTSRRAMAELPLFEGWITLPEAAKELGITRARAYQLVQEERITTAHRLGGRPIYIVREAEIAQLKAGRSGEVELVLPATPPDGEYFIVGGPQGAVRVTREQLEQAVALLRATQSTHGSFKQAMVKDNNPLAHSDYMGTTRAWRAAYPAQARGLNTKQVLIHAYEELLTAGDPPQLQAAV